MKMYPISDQYLNKRSSVLTNQIIQDCFFETINTDFQSTFSSKEDMPEQALS